MLLGISSYSNAEIVAVESPDCSHQLVGVGVAGRMRGEPLFSGYGIPAEGHYILNAQEAVVVEVALDLLGRCPAANHVRDYVNVELRHYRCAYCHLADPVPDQMP